MNLGFSWIDFQYPKSLPLTCQFNWLNFIHYYDTLARNNKNKKWYKKHRTTNTFHSIHGTQIVFTNSWMELVFCLSPLTLAEIHKTKQRLREKEIHDNCVITYSHLKLKRNDIHNWDLHRAQISCTGMHIFYMANMRFFFFVFKSRFHSNGSAFTVKEYRQIIVCFLLNIWRSIFGARHSTLL